MNKTTNSTDMLSATVAFRLTDEEWRTLALRADREQRTLSQVRPGDIGKLCRFPAGTSEQAWKEKHNVA